MKSIDAASLAELTINMLERTAMVLAEPAADGDEHPEPTRFAKIAYTGPTRGSLALCATDGFLRELAASLLGVETDDVNLETQGADALKEMANIVGGSVILALAGDRCEYTLGLPELVSASNVSQNAERERTECTVVAEGGSLRVLWRDDSTAKAA